MNELKDKIGIIELKLIEIITEYQLKLKKINQLKQIMK
jgi:hypothetical protein